MKKIISCTFLTIIILQNISCKKKNNNTEDELLASPQTTTAAPLDVKAYLPLKMGNYWIYQNNLFDTNGNVLYTGIDSVYVNDTARIAGRLFYHLNGGATNYRLLGYISDSSNCLIKDGGFILFKSSNVIDTIDKNLLYLDSVNNIYLKSYSIMKQTPNIFSFGANTFTNCLNNQNYYIYSGSACGIKKYFNHLYVPNVGLVHSSYFFLNMYCYGYYEQKLLRYKVN